MSGEKKFVHPRTKEVVVTDCLFHPPPPGAAFQEGHYKCRPETGGADLLFPASVADRLARDYFLAHPIVASEAVVPK